MLEDRPILRERVLAVSAISAVLIGGAMAMNAIITGGWQWGVASASPHQLYYDDADQRRSEPAPSVPVPQPVALANASFTTASAVSTLTPDQAAANAPGLDGGAAAAPLPSQPPEPVSEAQPIQPAPPVDDAASKARFDQLEADIRQADPQQAVAANDDQADSQ